MKKIILLSAFMLSLTFMGCEEAKDALPIGKMEATIDGSAWEAITRVAILESGFFTITGTSTNGDIISIIIRGNTEGTYELDVSTSGVDAKVAGFYKPAATNDDSESYIISSATVVLSDVNTSDKKISGTFAFEATRAEITADTTNVAVTNGIFEDVKYTES